MNAMKDALSREKILRASFNNCIFFCGDLFLILAFLPASCYQMMGLIQISNENSFTYSGTEEVTFASKELLKKIGRSSKSLLEKHCLNRSVSCLQ